MTVARRGTGIEWAIVVEHLRESQVNLGSGWSKSSNESDILGPTPEKSSLSMTSACVEPFLVPRGRPDALAFSTVLAARSTES